MRTTFIFLQPIINTAFMEKMITKSKQPYIRLFFYWYIWCCLKLNILNLNIWSVYCTFILFFYYIIFFWQSLAVTFFIFKITIANGTFIRNIFFLHCFYFIFKVFMNLLKSHQRKTPLNILKILFFFIFD